MLDECKDARDYLDAMRETVRMFSGVLNEREIVAMLLKRITGAIGAEKAMVQLISPNARRLIVIGSLGLSEDFLAAPETVSVESGINRKLLAGETVISAAVPGGAGEDLPGVVGIPFAVREYIIGTLNVYVSPDRMQDPEKMVFLRSLADLGALALERVHLQQSLYRIAAALNSSLELKPMMQQVLKATVREMWLKAASIRMLDSKKKVLRLVAVHGLSEEYLNKGEVHPAKSEIDQRLLKGETVVIEDLETNSGVEYPQAALAEGIHSMLMVPLKLKGRVLGVLRVYSTRPRRFGPVAQNFVKSVADLTSLAIENAELYGALQGRYRNLKVDLADWYRFLALG